MLPQKRTEASDTEDGRGNFRVRVIGGGSTSAATLREEDSRGLQIGLRIGTSSARTTVADEEDEEEAVRLEAEDAEPPVKARDMSELGPAEAQVPWRHKKRGRWNLKSWTVGMSIGSCAVAAIAVVAQLVARKAPAAAPVQAPVVEEPVNPHKQEVDYLVNHVGTLVPEAESLLQRYAAAKSPAEVLPLIRRADSVGPKLTAKWKPWGEGPALASSEKVENIVEYTTEWPSLLLRGKKSNFDPFELQFVREQGVLKIDWEASEGMGDCSVADLQGGFMADNATVRAKITPANFYTPAFPEGGFRSYQLSDFSRYDFVWAFAPVGSPEAEFLSEALDEDSKILSRRDQDQKVVPLTLKLSGPKAEGVKIFLITGILHKGWVTP